MNDDDVTTNQYPEDFDPNKHTVGFTAYIEEGHVPFNFAELIQEIFMATNWVGFKKIDRQRLITTCNKLFIDKDLVAWPSVDQMLILTEQILRANTVQEAIKLLTDTGVKTQTAELVAVRLWQLYKDLTDGNSLDQNIVAISLNVTESEMRQIKSEMSKLQIADLDIFIRSAIEFRSKVLALTHKNNLSVIIKSMSGTEMVVSLEAPKSE